MKNKNIYFSSLVIACFLSGVLYSISFPVINIYLIRFLNSKYLAMNQIIICIFTVIFSLLWNKYSDKLYKFFIAFLIVEAISYTTLNTLMILKIVDTVVYYILDTILFSIITRNIVCGITKLKSLLYKSEEREKYDNAIDVAGSAAVLLGSVVVLIIPNIPIEIAFIISNLGICIDNIFYIDSEIKRRRKNKNE